MLRHQFSNALFAYANAARNQLFPHARPAVLAFDLRVNRLDMRQQRIVAYTASAGLVLRGTLPPLMKAARAHIEHVAQHRNRPVMAIALDERVLHVDSFAKYAHAFLRNSRNQVAFA